jgi:cytochrome c-type biogenesis protein CcmF
MDFANEHTLIGQVGHAFVIIAFMAAIVSAICYFYASRDIKTGNEGLGGGSLFPWPRPIREFFAPEATIASQAGWKKMGRWAFLMHAAAVLIVIGLIFLMIINHYYEYEYVWKHSNNVMPMRYIFSCFWEGQEGSFLLWTFWHVILGLVLLKKAKTWEAPVMTTFSLVQAFLVSMLLGLYLFGHKFGNSPFILIRELADNVGMPWTTVNTYLEMPAFADGRGLNPLLQNYWMTIHPPTLFLGFASTLVPFCYAIAGLWKNKLSEWMKPAAPWAFFGVMVLGIGVLMGGAWAYEALSFGGFWAWDPVENASLVPWITLVGAAHVMLVRRKKKEPSFVAIALTLLTFILILYSTFLTRSGVLGDSSVHSFVGEGMLGQLLVYLLFFIWLSFYLILRSRALRLIFTGISLILLILDVGMKVGGTPIHEYSLTIFLGIAAAMIIISYLKHFPKLDRDDELWSREFWMFIGALVLLLSAFQIIITTSIPVYNLLYGGEMAPPNDAIDHYNRWQLPFAVIVTLLIAVGQWFKYKKTNMGQFGRRILLSFLFSIGFTWFAVVAMDFNMTMGPEGELHYAMLLFSGIFAVASNLDYMIRVAKLKPKNIGSSVAHMGFGLIIIGALLSTSQSQHISQNMAQVDITQLGDNMENNKSMLLTERDTFPMGSYFVVYRGRELEGINMMYKVDYFHGKPVQYAKEDFVYTPIGIYRALVAHEAASSFEKDSEKWEIVETNSDNMGDLMEVARPWKPAVPGEFAFTLSPRVQLSEKFENTPEPDTRHFPTFDIYTHVQWADLTDPRADTAEVTDPYTPFKEYEMKVSDTLITSSVFIVIDSITPLPLAQYDSFALRSSDYASTVHFALMDEHGETEHHKGYAILRDSVIPVTFEVDIPAKGMRLMVGNYRPSENTIALSLSEKKKDKQDMIVLQAIIFPYINVLWLGCILMFIGTFLARFYRSRQVKATETRVAIKEPEENE